jgi:hypothetical protein
MTPLSEQRCLHHGDREAVARCPACGHFFCRECITEHDRRVICSSCLAKLARPPAKRRARLRGVLAVVPAVVSLFLLWFLFYGAGRLPLSIPSDFHEGTIWRSVTDY